MIYFEMKFLFFSLMKRTKNQGFGFVVKAHISIFFWNYRFEALYFVHSWKCWFCRWSAAQLPPKVSHFSSFTKSNNPKAKGHSELGEKICKWNKLVVFFRWFILKSVLCSFAWSKEPKIKASGLLLKRISRFFFEIIASRRFILFTPENADFVGDLLRSFLQKSSISVRSQNPTIPMPKGLFWIGS